MKFCSMLFQNFGLSDILMRTDILLFMAYPLNKFQREMKTREIFKINSKIRQTTRLDFALREN